MGVLTRRRLKVDDLVQGVVAGDRLLLSRAISRVESEHPDAHALLSALFPHSGRAHIIGVTGAPGTGKSTLVTALAKAWRAEGMSVAIVAIDPTSPFTGGALLGDRVRMRSLSGDEGVFIRSMATRGSLGGLSKTTGDAVTVLDAAGFARVIVETVGVGQAEVEIASTAHTTLVVEAPGLGDEVQAIKAGILEIADLLVVNKADRPGADRTVRALQLMLELEADSPRPVNHHGHIVMVAREDERAHGGRWRVDVARTTAVTGEGVEDVRARIESHRNWLHESGEYAQRERLRIAHTLENIIRSELNRRIVATMPAEGLAATVEAVRRRETDPYRAADALLAQF